MIRVGKQKDGGSIGVKPPRSTSPPSAAQLNKPRLSLSILEPSLISRVGNSSPELRHSKKRWSQESL
jgi:hypothetical protein